MINVIPLSIKKGFPDKKWRKEDSSATSEKNLLVVCLFVYYFFVVRERDRCESERGDAADALRSESTRGTRPRGTGPPVPCECFPRPDTSAPSSQFLLTHFRLKFISSGKSRALSAEASPFHGGPSIFSSFFMRLSRAFLPFSCNFESCPAGRRRSPGALPFVLFVGPSPPLGSGKETFPGPPFK